MKKPYNVMLILLLILNFFVGAVLFQQNTLLNEYSQKIKNLEGRMKDLHDVIESDVVPRLEEMSDDDKVSKAEEKQDKWEVRYAYVKNGEEIMTVSTGPNIVAGEENGYLFSFNEPFETYKGKELTIYAVHKETGEIIAAVPPTTIREPSPGYSSLGRYGANFSVPKSGLWRYEVRLDGKIYADVVLAVKE